MNNSNAHLYLPLVQALAEGKTVQYNSGNQVQPEWEDMEQFNFSEPASEYRLKPPYIDRAVAEELRKELKPGQKVIWRDAFRWKDDNGTLSNHYEGQSLAYIAEEHDYTVIKDAGCAGIIADKNWKPLPEPAAQVPLEASDVPIGSAFRHPHHPDIVYTPFQVSVLGIVTYNGHDHSKDIGEYPKDGGGQAGVWHRSWGALASDGWQIHRPGNLDTNGKPIFVPCSKPA